MAFLINSKSQRFLFDKQVRSLVNIEASLAACNEKLYQNNQRGFSVKAKDQNQIVEAA